MTCWFDMESPTHDKKRPKICENRQIERCEYSIGNTNLSKIVNLTTKIYRKIEYYIFVTYGTFIVTYGTTLIKFWREYYSIKFGFFYRIVISLVTGIKIIYEKDKNISLNWDILSYGTKMYGTLFFTVFYVWIQKLIKCTNNKYYPSFLIFHVI